MSKAKKPPHREPVREWAVTVRPEGTRFRAVVLEIHDGAVVGEAAGDAVYRTTAMDYAAGAVQAMTMGSVPHLPNAKYREVG